MIQPYVIEIMVNGQKMLGCPADKAQVKVVGDAFNDALEKDDPEPGMVHVISLNLGISAPEKSQGKTAYDLVGEDGN